MKLLLKDDDAAVAEAKPSATIIVARESQVGIEVLLLQRNPELAHMPGAWVFPGGKVDAGDEGESLEARARQAAARELLEEAGLQLEPDALLAFSHWLTPEMVKRRFATWFYLALLDADPPVTVDGSEIVDYRWVTPEQALNEQLSGTLSAPPPTLVSLYDIASHGGKDALLEGVAQRVPPYFFPKLHSVENAMLFLYPGDAGYESNRVDVEGARHRMVLGKGVFDYQRSFDWPKA